MKVCHVCSAHRADDVRVFHRECVALSAAGYEVHLIACAAGTRPFREAGVVIHPLPEPRGRRERLARRARVARLAARLKPALFHVHEPELLGPVIARAGGRPVLWDVHESYLDVLGERAWIPRRLRPLARLAWDRQERRLLRSCAAVVATSEWIARRYRPLHKTVRLVCNYPDLDWVNELPPAQRDGKTCVFTGGLQPNRGLFQALAALALLKARGLSVPLELAGRPVSDEYLRSLLDEAKRLGLGELVRYHGILPRAESTKLQHRSSIGLVTTLPTAGNNLVNVPIKLMDFMGLGLPIVFSDFPNHRELAGASGVGIAVDPNRPEQIADAIERLVKNPDLARQMGEAGQRAVRERFNWDIERATLLALSENTRLARLRLKPSQREFAPFAA